MRYKNSIAEEMKWLAKKKDTVFLGEGLKNAGSIYGTMDGVPSKKCVEMPICENLIVGAAIGLALDGWRPVVVFQRMDFMLIASDAIINHLCLLGQMSGGQVKAPVIIRAIIGSQSEKFWVGEQHNHDFTHVFKPYIETHSYRESNYKTLYDLVLDRPVLIVEERDKY